MEKIQSRGLISNSETPSRRLRECFRHLRRVKDPSQFYKWQGDLFSQGGTFFKNDGLSHKERREMKFLKNENAKLTHHIEKKKTAQLQR